MKRFLVEVCSLASCRDGLLIDSKDPRHLIRRHLDVKFADEVHKIAETLAAYIIDTALEHRS